ncbi:hypothetical protein TNCV_2549271 [Trichonephila clavipes]|nr:hypothetical protein TNCV_2549271 [Trichonephila clavipes]
MRYHRALRHTSSVRSLETFRSIFAVTLPLIRSNSLDAQLAVPNDPRYAGLETCLGIGKTKEEYEKCKYSLVTPLPCEPSIVLFKNGSWEPFHEWQHMWLEDVIDIPLGCHGATDQYK